MAKMCSLRMNLGVPELRKITKSTKSQIKLNIQNIELKHTMVYYGSREKTVRQIEVLRFIRIGKARQNYF